MAQVKTLSEIERDETVKIMAINGASKFQERLQEMGLIPGTVVSLISKIAFGGPLALHVRGSKIALRRQDTNQILVSA